MDDALPAVGDWYRDAQGQLFEVVAVDEDAGTVEVQLYDGELAEYDLESWGELAPEPVEPPEDWSAPFDDVERDELGDTDLPAGPRVRSPLDGLDLD
ncbi:MAG: hypothetical protein D6809_05095 [Gammaproteobacteria bacterium]|nr:MAG: hypothetical protein D6809_05095 [Gammaproteobacteria bacterium]